MAFLLLIILMLLVPLFRSTQATDTARRQEYYRPCPLPKCDTCPSVEDLRAPGIGLALDTAYGAAAVRLHDGTHNHIVLVEGDEEYTELMLRLATGPMDRTPDHFNTINEELQYMKSRAARLANKLVGRPATPDTAILASMVSKLLKATRSWLGEDRDVTKAVLSSPDRIRLTAEEIGDVFDYLKLQNLMDGSLYGLYAASSTYAGYSKGLCQNFTDAYACEKEEWDFPNQRVLHLDLNSKSLSGTIEGLKTAMDGSVDSSFVEPRLGLGDGRTSEAYWTDVSDRIRELARTVQRFAYIPYVTELVLSGPSAADGRFHAAVRAALHDLVVDGSVLAVLSADDAADGVSSTQEEEVQSFFSFATARGAAEIAKRLQEGPVKCAQSDECRRRRERVHGEQRQSIVHQTPRQDL